MNGRDLLPEGGGRSRWADAVISPRFSMVVLAVGALLRIREFAANRSLWLDESMLALNIVDRSFAGLIGPLDYSQAAPLGFLFLVKAASQLFGQGEYGLRLVPLLFGLLSLPLFYKVARDFLTPTAVPLAVALFAILSPFIYYSSELKQYSGDVMCVLVLLAVAYPPPPSGAYSAGRALRLALVGAAVLWVSHAALIMLAAVGLVLLLPSVVRTPSRNFTPLAGVIATWAGSFAAFYHLSLRFLAANQVMFRYWSPSFVPWPPSKTTATWLLDKFVDGGAVASIFADPAAFRPAGVALFAWAVGCVFLFARHRKRFWLVVAPLLLALAAAALGRYPFVGRLILFTAPLILLGVAQGAVFVAQTAGRQAPAIGIVLIGLLLFPAVKALDNVLAPEGREEIKPVLSYVMRHHQGDDPVYVYFAARPAFNYYVHRHASFPKVIDGTRLGESDYSAIERDLDGLRHRGRVWFVFSHVGENEEKFFVDYLDRMGRRLDKFAATGSAAYLYDLGR